MLRELWQEGLKFGGLPPWYLIRVELTTSVSRYRGGRIDIIIIIYYYYCLVISVFVKSSSRKKNRLREVNIMVWYPPMLGIVMDNTEWYDIVPFHSSFAFSALAGRRL